MERPRRDRSVIGIAAETAQQCGVLDTGLTGADVAGLIFGSRLETSHFFAALVVMQRDSVRAECVRKAQGAPCLGRGSSALESDNLP